MARNEGGHELRCTDKKPSFAYATTRMRSLSRSFRSHVVMTAVERDVLAVFKGFQSTLSKAKSPTISYRATLM